MGAHRTGSRHRDRDEQRDRDARGVERNTGGAVAGVVERGARWSRLADGGRVVRLHRDVEIQVLGAERTSGRWRVLMPQTPHRVRHEKSAADLDCARRGQPE